MRYLLLCPLLFLMACETETLNTGQNLTVNLKGADSAFCWLKTSDNRYELYAPGTAFVERTSETMTIDCDDNHSDRRRVVKLKSQVGLGYWNYPEEVTIDFTTLDNGDRFNGFRANDDQAALTPVPSAAADDDGKTVDMVITEILTEDSFSVPVETDQTYPVKKDYVMGRRSEPVLSSY